MIIYSSNKSHLDVHNAGLGVSQRDVLHHEELCRGPVLSPPPAQHRIGSTEL